MPCWICNPYCGNCKPPAEKPVKCPQCNTFNIFIKAGEKRICKKCGTILPEGEVRPIVFCSYCGLECANQCKRYKLVPKDGVLLACPWITPPNGNGKTTE